MLFDGGLGFMGRYRTTFVSSRYLKRLSCSAGMVKMALNSGMIPESMHFLNNLSLWVW